MFFLRSTSGKKVSQTAFWFLSQMQDTVSTDGVRHSWYQHCLCCLCLSSRSRILALLELAATVTESFWVICADRGVSKSLEACLDVDRVAFKGLLAWIREEGVSSVLYTIM